MDLLLLNEINLKLVLNNRILGKKIWHRLDNSKAPQEIGDALGQGTRVLSMSN
jgi:hypothetical protein